MQNSYDRDETIPTERIGIITYTLTVNAGRVYTVRELSLIVGLSWPATYEMLCKLSRVLPLVQNDDSNWMMIRQGRHQDM